MRLALPAVALPLLLGGCSLVLEDAPIPTCSSDDECAPLSQLRGHPASCRKYFCNEGRCEEHPDGAEVCDGHDNDCDGVIDEPSAVGEGPWRSGGVMVEGVVSGTDVRFGEGPERSAVATWVTRTEARHAKLVLDSVASPDPIGYQTNASDDLMSAALSDGCRDASSGMIIDTCDATEVASDNTATHEILATINTNGCAAGRVHVGHTPPTTPHDGVPIVLRGPLRRSNSFLGIDVGDDKCTGASRPECTDDGACGATRPALAVIDHGFTTDAVQQRAAEALVTWIGAPASRDACGGDEAPVEAVVAHLLRVQIGMPFFWTTVSNEGVPAVLGRTTGGGAPAVDDFGDDGWFAAFADEAGRVALRWVPSQPEPAEVGRDNDLANDRTDVETPPIDGVVELGTLDVMDGAPDHVAIAVGSLRPGGVELGVAWREGCGRGTEQSIAFRRVVIATDGGGPASIESVSDAVRLERVDGSSDTVLDPPSLTYRSTGFVVNGFSRGGQTADDTNDGGWTVAWARGDDGDGDGDVDTGGRVHAVRISELDGAPVADGAIGDLTQPGANADEVFVYAGTRWAYRDRAAEAFVGGALVCGP